VCTDDNDDDEAGMDGDQMVKGVMEIQS